VNASAALTADVPPGVVTVTSTAPADAAAGAVAVIDVSEFTVNELTAVAPNATALAPARLLPLIVTDVPPLSGPDDGLTPLTAGAAV
jgi:hypothetical protein